MNHRPYPNRGRALRQLHRHDPRRGLILVPPAFAPLVEGMAQLRQNTRRALTAQTQWTGDKVMSTH
ncbi:hypothetical protein [Streptomyces sp. NPDC047042]|uniref:hypothetical protein n=1 Tax=Streptomyces sp. NPDC047042 TaxID=3154807 RepID=UPI0033F351E0